MSDRTHTVGIYTLGCKVNQYESEAIAEGFTSRGFLVQSPTAVCDVYVINTCTVTAESDRKARQFIRRAIHKNPHAFVLVTGCYAQVSASEVAGIVGVDYVCGNDEKCSVIDAACALIEQGKKPSSPIIRVHAPDACGFEEMHITRFDRTRAYIKIEDGCENRCTYCIIPSARGSVRSKKPQDVIAEVRELIRGGCREIVLTGIETASYGKDLDGYRLADLLEEIDRIPGIGRVRLGSLDPGLMTQEFVDRIAKLKSLTPHFHLSMQSGSDRILALMKRKYNTRMACEGVQRLRAALPNPQFTTDMIVGFPGETEEDFAQSMAFAREIGFLMIHVFPYSRRKGTLADTMTDQIPEDVKHTRVARLSAVAADARAACLAKKVGMVEEILVEGFHAGMAHGHTADFCEVEVPVKRPPATDELIKVRILSHDGNRCRGELYFYPNAKEN